jgi:hypothetical protein
MDSMGIPLAFQGNIIVKKNTNLKDQTPYSTTDDISISVNACPVVPYNC